VQLNSPITIAEANERDVDGLSALFDAYRVFYGRASDLPGAKRFVAARCAQGPTRFFVAADAGEAAGFMHLLPSFDTLAMRPMWILEDLYVDETHRKRGVGSALLRHAEAFARASGAARLSLTTAMTNQTAQRLYAAHGWERDTHFVPYHRMLP